MKRNERHPEHRATTRALVACATLALAMLLGAAPSSADPDHGRRGGSGHVYRHKAGHVHKHKRQRARDHVVIRRDVVRIDNDVYRVHKRHRRHRDFVVPRKIRHRDVVRYEPYRYGSVYHRRHRHYHAVYHFPVYTHRGVRYRAYTYCGNRFFAGGSVVVGGPRFRVRFDF
jgi:hypothetical protein